MLRRLLLALSLVLVASPVLARPVILIGIDGFRADYLDRGLTPTLAQLAQAGATAEGGMRPSYPTVTYPNFYTLVTGLHPDRHGLVYNAMTDPDLPGREFHLRDRAEVMDGVWWEDGEPIWVTAERAGQVTASVFWPGSEARIRAERPTYWLPFDQSLTSHQRVNLLLGWFNLAEAERPDFAALYFDIVDTQGHHYGPDSPDLEAALAEVDAAVGRLVEGLRRRAIQADLVIVADHGMAAISAERIVWLDDLVAAEALAEVGHGSVATVTAEPGRDAEVAGALAGSHPHLECWRREDIPVRYAYGRHRRVAPLICQADVGWTIGVRGRTDPARVRGGAHGYDNAAPEMRALFIASGPSFLPGTRLSEVDSVDVQPLLARLLGIAAPAGDGRLADTAPALR